MIRWAIAVWLDGHHATRMRAAAAAAAYRFRASRIICYELTSAWLM